MLHFEDTQSTPTPAGHSYIVLLIFLAVRSETWLHRPLKPKAEDMFLCDLFLEYRRASSLYLSRWRCSHFSSRDEGRRDRASNYLKVTEVRQPAFRQTGGSIVDIEVEGNRVFT